MPRAWMLILAALLWGNLLNAVPAQIPPTSQRSGQLMRDPLLTQQQRQLLMLQMAAARAMPLMRPLPPVPPPPPYDRAIDSLEWMTAGSGAIVVAHFDRVFIESSKY